MMPQDLLLLPVLPIDRIPDIRLTPQPTFSRETGVCPSQAIAWLTGEEHTESPTTLCPVIGHIVDGMANSLTDEDRDRLVRPFLTSLVSTRTTPRFEHLRRHSATLWAAKVNLTQWLLLAGLMEEYDHITDSTVPEEQPTPDSITNILEQRQTALAQIPDLQTGTLDLEVDQALGETGLHSIGTLPKGEQLTRYFRGIPSLAYSAALTAKQRGKDPKPSIQKLQQDWLYLLYHIVRIPTFSRYQAEDTPTKPDQA